MCVYTCRALGDSRSEGDANDWLSHHSGEDEPSCAIEDEGSLVRLIDLYGEHLVTKVTKT